MIGLAIRREIPEADYEATANKLIEKKVRDLGGELTYEKRAKILRYMQQKGYEIGLTKRLLG